MDCDPFDSVSTPSLLLRVGPGPRGYDKSVYWPLVTSVLL